MNSDTKPALRPDVAEAIAWMGRATYGCKFCHRGGVANAEASMVRAELERLAAENAELKGKGCRQCGVAAADMVTDTYCAACRVEELKADNGWWAGKCEQLQSAVATLRSQLSRIDYAFGEPNEMGVSPYDVDCDGERVVRQVEAILKGEVKGGW